METRASSSELVSELKRWCRGEELDDRHSLMVLVPEGVEVTQIEATMETIKALQLVHVRRWNFNQKLKLLTVLCECREEVDSSKVPSEVMPDGETEAWNLVMESEGAELVEEPQGSPVEGVVHAALVVLQSPLSIPWVSY